MYQRAFMLKARVLLLPNGHPARLQLAVALASGITSLATQVSELQSDRRWSEIPDITDIIHGEELLRARRCRDSRRNCLATYRNAFVDPALRAHDDLAMTDSTSQGWAYSEFLPGCRPSMARSLNFDWQWTSLT